MTEKYLAQKKYLKENIRELRVKLNKNTDADIIEYLESVDNKQGLVKMLLRRWMWEQKEAEKKLRRN
ncbi:hypothetical protein [Emergencia sp. 1XD21-10]|uniref:hypothetical protein n=1 Tax=Emergencia sp. 1XD21-10 TaxID=2304569 RepID=UPI001379EA35|nr:hypothetical protein [Emergencia sp. 1XD21-10]NCF00431.1 hypothetical protein [Emergencia sp. 1XD21-10]